MVLVLDVCSAGRPGGCAASADVVDGGAGGGGGVSVSVGKGLQTILT